MLIGYMRPYVNDESCEQQLQQLQSFGCERIVQEEHAEAKRRIQLKQLLANLQQHDTLVVTRLFSLADSTRHLMEMLEILSNKSAYLYSIQEQIDTKRLDGLSFQQTVQHLIDFQSDVISERTKLGLLIAKKKGHAAGRPRKPDENVQQAVMMYQSKSYTLAEIKEATGISKSTLYRYLEN